MKRRHFPLVGERGKGRREEESSSKSNLHSLTTWDKDGEPPVEPTSFSPEMTLRPGRTNLVVKGFGFLTAGVEWAKMMS